MAAAAAEVGAGHLSVPEAEEISKVYERLRVEARKVHIRAGWGTEDEFDSEMPPLGQDLEPGLSPIAAISASATSHRAVRVGLRARVLLGQLAAWAGGHQETFEIEAQFEANAAAQAAAAVAAARPPMGFTS